MIFRFRETTGKGIEFIDDVGRLKPVIVIPFVSLTKYRMLGVVKRNQLSSMHRQLLLLVVELNRGTEHLPINSRVSGLRRTVVACLVKQMRLFPKT